jgi:hypothetical protein
MKLIQMKLMDPVSRQNGIVVSATIPALKLYDTKIRISINPVKTQQIINLFVLTGYIAITTAKMHKGN